MSPLSEMKVVRTKTLPKHGTWPLPLTPLYYSRSQNTVWLGVTGMDHQNLCKEFELRVAEDETLVSGVVVLDDDDDEHIFWTHGFQSVFLEQLAHLDFDIIVSMPFGYDYDLLLGNVGLHISEKVFGVKPLMS